MWPFSSQPPIVDTTEYIYLTEDGSLGYPLIYPDESVYQQGIEKITSILKEWMVQDIAYTTNLNQPIESSLSHQFQSIDIKYLPYPAQQEVLFNCLRDTEINNSGSRFFDTIIRIHTYVALDIINTFKGRFLACMLYGLPQAINDIPLPKHLWKALLVEHNWIPFISIIQDISDNEDTITKIKSLASSRRSTITTVRH